MNKINRRSALGMAGAGLTAAVATTAGAVAASASKAEALPELPVDKLHRISVELAKALDEWCADLAWCGKPDYWAARIYPASYTTFPIGFEHLDDDGPQADPLLDAVLAYKAGNEAYCAAGDVPDDETTALAEATYAPPMRLLDAWDVPAKTKEGAVAALRLALEEAGPYSASPMINTMLVAALRYLDPTDAVTI